MKSKRPNTLTKSIILALLAWELNKIMGFVIQDQNEMNDNQKKYNHSCLCAGGLVPAPLRTLKPGDVQFLYIK